MSDVLEVEEPQTESQRRAEWLDGLHRVYEFFRTNPDQIPRQMGASVLHIPPNTAAAVQVLAESTAGPLTVGKETGTYVTVSSSTFGPHHISLFVPKAKIGRKVQDAIPEVWAWNDGIVEVAS